MYSKNKVLKSCDYITLDIRDTDTFINADAADIIKDFSWFIPNGAYRSVIEQPNITTVELISGSVRGVAIEPGLVVRYLNGGLNQYVHSGKSPVIAYGNVRASNSPVLLGVGEMVVNDRPNFINISVTQADDDDEGFRKDAMEGFIFTLKYSYYEEQQV